jgi:hypothetical protein
VPAFDCIVGLLRGHGPPYGDFVLWGAVGVEHGYPKRMADRGTSVRGSENRSLIRSDCCLHLIRSLV